MTLVAGADDRLAFRAARELDRRPALAVLVAPPASGDAAVCRGHAGVRHAAEPPAGGGRLRPAACEGRQRGIENDVFAAAAVDGRLPVSWLPAAATPVSGEGSGRRALVAAARDNVQTLVRACWPGTLAPALSSTRLDFAFVAARHTGVGILSASDASSAALLARLRLWGFPGARLATEDGGWEPPVTGRAVFYQPGARRAALALAGDLGLPARSVVQVDDSPRKVVISSAE